MRSSRPHQPWAGHVPGRRIAPSQSPNWLKTEEGVIARAFEVAAVGCPFMFPIYGALGAVHVKDDPLVLGVSYGPIYPLLVRLPQPLHVPFADRDLGLKSAQGG